MFLCLAGLGGLCGRAIQFPFEDQPARRLGQVGQDLVAAAASPDGQWVAGLRSQGNNQWSVTVWETVSGRELLKPQRLPHPPATTNALAWSPNSQQLAVGSSDTVSLYQISSQSRKQLKAEWLVRDVRWSQDWVMARCDNAVFVWRCDTGKLVLRLPQDHLLTAALSGPQGVLATASFQDSIRLFSVPKGRLLRTLPAGPATVGLEFVHQEEWLATAFRFQGNRDRDCAILYDWRTGKAQTPSLPQPHLVGFSVSQDGGRLLTRSEQVCRVWDGASGRMVLERPLASPYIDSLSADGQWVASLPDDSADMVLWRADTGSPVCRLEHARRPFRFRFFQVGLLQVLDGSCSVWQIDPGSI